MIVIANEIYPLHWMYIRMIFSEMVPTKTIGTVVLILLFPVKHILTEDIKVPIRLPLCYTTRLLDNSIVIVT